MVYYDSLGLLALEEFYFIVECENAICKCKNHLAITSLFKYQYWLLLWYTYIFNVIFLL